MRRLAHVVSSIAMVLPPPPPRALALALAFPLALTLAYGCRRGAPPAPVPSDNSAPMGGETLSARLGGVVNPWTWPRARGATDRERAIEDIGPYEPLDRARPDSPLVSPNADTWTRLVGIAWDRDVDIDFVDEPVDLDGDGAPDTRITRHVHAKGGVLGNPTLFGLVATPLDPRGRIGRVSASTGFLGLREALTPDGKPSAQIGMTCFLCHGGRDPDSGRVVLGLPATTFDYGLLLATAAVLDDGNAAAAAHRRTQGYPSGRTVRARLLLSGPGRQDLTGEFGLDVTVPGLHSFHYSGARRVRQGTVGVVNPISVPGILSAAGVDLQNWSGSEVASGRWLRRLIDLGRQPARALFERLGLPGSGGDSGSGGVGGDDRPGDGVVDVRDAAATRRALLLDLRNLGTLGLQQDSYPGLLWADAVYGNTTLDPDDVVAIPRMYGTAALRRVLANEAPQPHRPPDGAAAARGKLIFANRIVGTLANRQILREAPAAYAAVKPGGPTHTPLLAPIDEALPPTFGVRCADCHSATPGGAPISFAAAAQAAAAPPSVANAIATEAAGAEAADAAATVSVSLPFGRCDHCHRGHSPIAEPRAVGSPPNGDPDTRDRITIAALGVPRDAAGEVAFCLRCHTQHRPFAPVVFSSSLLLPFDTDGDGRSQDDEADDARAGGIGTEALLAFDVPRPQRPPEGFALDLPALSRLHRVAPLATARIGAGWVRVPPLAGVRATAPYLHNGSVPTLRALLDAVPRRPITFPLGATGFVFDTRLTGNRNIGHAYGTALTRREKADLVAYLETL